MSAAPDARHTTGATQEEHSGTIDPRSGLNGQPHSIIQTGRRGAGFTGQTPGQTLAETQTSKDLGHILDLFCTIRRQAGSSTAAAASRGNHPDQQIMDRIAKPGQRQSHRQTNEEVHPAHVHFPTLLRSQVLRYLRYRIRYRSNMASTAKSSSSSRKRWLGQRIGSWEATCSIAEIWINFFMPTTSRQKRWPGSEGPAGPGCAEAQPRTRPPERLRPHQPKPERKTVPE